MHLDLVVMPARLRLTRNTVQLIQPRAEVVEEAGNIKREADLPVTVANRKKQVIEKAQALAPPGVPPVRSILYSLYFCICPTLTCTQPSNRGRVAVNVPTWAVSLRHISTI